MLTITILLLNADKILNQIRYSIHLIHYHISTYPPKLNQILLTEHLDIESFLAQHRVEPNNII